MKTGWRCTAVAASVAVGVSLGWISAGLAGGGSLDENDEGQNTGTPFFGFVKDADRGNVLSDAKVTAELKNGNASLVTRSDSQGHYRITGFGQDVDPNQVDIACSKDGYKLHRAVKRKLSNDAGAPVEVDCLMLKQ
jgi:Carboxypeptidase regulatory-like domain